MAGSEIKQSAGAAVRFDTVTINPDDRTFRREVLRTLGVVLDLLAYLRKCLQNILAALGTYLHELHLGAILGQLLGQSLSLLVLHFPLGL